MSVSVSLSPSLPSLLPQVNPPVQPAPTAPSQAGTTPIKAADGDYKAKTALTLQKKDIDGDFKPISSANSAASSSSSSVQAALISLVKGG